jgi:hypothetical protein
MLHVTGTSVENLGVTVLGDSYEGIVGNLGVSP